MKTTIGRIVIYFQGDWEICGEMYPAFNSLVWEDRQKFVDDHRNALRGRNGTRVHPAIITQVWSDECVNLTIFFADGTFGARSSAGMLAAGADEAIAKGGWRWPERVA